ncbi:GNAT family N-acetyltransferase [Ruminococcus albus]|uniref:Acetyltransferase (GNAT) domain-containing protein n=1 Tax=Ruminococcus albus TaxID=1264 RepID=A0A1H7P860_RUMAL|nr:GNAT family N-acetyltransferase [Ruminococcus albus]SEL31435.1 Acetyltransferase (GNAT) domain-containing protein [Ruminococcus albus]
MKLAEDLTEIQLRKIRYVIGDAFVSNELFHEFGSIEERRQLVLKYMAAYVDHVYETSSLYMTDDGLGYIGLQYSGDIFALSQMKMLWRIFLRLPFCKLKNMLRHIKQIADENWKYAQKPHIDMLMVAVEKRAQGKGYATKLVSFAQDMAKKKGVPLLADTDMKSYAEMYQYLGFELYNTKTASNGVTRYNLVWKP